MPNPFLDFQREQLTRVHPVHFPAWHLGDLVVLTSVQRYADISGDRLIPDLLSAAEALPKGGFLCGGWRA